MAAGRIFYAARSPNGGGAPSFSGASRLRLRTPVASTLRDEARGRVGPMKNPYWRPRHVRADVSSRDPRFASTA